MIISLDDAKTIYPDVTQEELDGIEQSIRAETNNPFQNKRIRFEDVRFEDNHTLTLLGEAEGLRTGDTVQISGSKWNNGLYVIQEVDGMTITLSGEPRLFAGNDTGAFLTKIEYPSDILSGVMKLLKYDAKMADKIGLKSKTVSRMSETYFDQNSTESIAGYPAAMMSFINKYRLMKW
ncbi:hypothetical protein [Enterococcus italicus]|uniref:hypothetical protein n=1 Tax=Enterococcus italicus TaxID=246144 RepID=UPI0028B01B7E|nr:hypothetical protein [Enterococcus italicus]